MDRHANRNRQMLIDYARETAYRMILASLMAGGGFGVLVTGYLVKSALGIDLMENHFFLHGLFFD